MGSSDAKKERQVATLPARSVLSVDEDAGKARAVTA